MERARPPVRRVQPPPEKRGPAQCARRGNALSFQAPTKAILGQPAEEEERKTEGGKGEVKPCDCPLGQKRVLILIPGRSEPGCPLLALSAASGGRAHLNLLMESLIHPERSQRKWSPQRILQHLPPAAPSQDAASAGGDPIGWLGRAAATGSGAPDSDSVSQQKSERCQRQRAVAD